MSNSIQPIQLFNSIDPSTILLTILTLISLTVIYLQHKNILLSPYSSSIEPSQKQNQTDRKKSPESRMFNPFPSQDHGFDHPSGPKWARCRHCSRSKPIASLKMCSRCKLPSAAQKAPIPPASSPEDPPVRSDSTHVDPPREPTPDFNVYYCDQTCQRSNWKSHKLVCGQFKDLRSTLSPAPTQRSRSHRLSIRDFITWDDGQAWMKEWSEFHKNLLIFTTIQALDLIRCPQNSITLVNVINLEINKAHPRVIRLVSSSLEPEDRKMFELSDEVQKIQDRIPRPPGLGGSDDDQDSKIYDVFRVTHFGPVEALNLSRTNHQMFNITTSLDRLRMDVRLKGGMGVASLFVCHERVFRHIPIVLPSQADLDAVPRHPNWRELFDEAIKSGISWNSTRPPPRAPSA